MGAFNKAEYFQIQLEGNCDFSSNNDVWTCFMSFLAAILNFVGLF